MAAEPIARRFTVAEYYRMGKAGILKENDRVELIEGEIIQMPPIGDLHAWCVKRLLRLFVLTFRDAAIVSVQDPLRLNNRSEPVPDLVLIRPRPELRGPHPTRTTSSCAASWWRYSQRCSTEPYARTALRMASE